MATAKKKTAKAKAPKMTAIKEALSKTQQIELLSEITELSKKEIKSVLEAQEIIISRCLKKGAVGHITLPQGLKVEVKVKPARKARKGINPFTKEEMTFKAKPAQRVVKIKALKKVKDAAA